MPEAVICFAALLNGLSAFYFFAGAQQSRDAGEMFMTVFLCGMAISNIACAVTTIMYALGARL